MTPLLEIDLTAGFGERPRVLDGVRFSVAEGESYGLVGESGAGKSTVALALLGMLGWSGGRATGAIRWRGENLLERKERDLRRLRGKEIALVPQSPAAALNPALTLAAHFEETWRAHGAEPWRTARARVSELLEAVQLPSNDPFLKKRPRELSVGMAQRFVIALALLHRPALLIADEPTSALDPITQAQVLKLFEAIHQRGAALLYISHDLPSVAKLCGRIAILHEGKVVESGISSELFSEPRHPYTRRLTDAIAAWPPRN